MAKNLEASFKSNRNSFWSAQLTFNHNQFTQWHGFGHAPGHYMNQCCKYTDSYMRHQTQTKWLVSLVITHAVVRYDGWRQRSSCPIIHLFPWRIYKSMDQPINNSTNILSPIRYKTTHIPYIMYTDTEIGISRLVWVVVYLQEQLLILETQNVALNIMQKWWNITHGNLRVGVQQY